MPGARIELAQPYDRGILSPLRLPVPPPGLIVQQCIRLAEFCQLLRKKVMMRGSGRLTVAKKRYVVLLLIVLSFSFFGTLNWKYEKICIHYVLFCRPHGGGNDRFHGV